MHLALTPRAHTTVLAILRLLEMVLIVKVSLVFEGDEIFILFPTLNVAVNCLDAQVNVCPQFQLDFR